MTILLEEHLHSYKRNHFIADVAQSKRKAAVGPQTAFYIHRFCLFLRPQLLELQAEYHKNSHQFLDKNISELKENHSQKGELS